MVISVFSHLHFMAKFLVLKTKILTYKKKEAMQTIAALINLYRIYQLGQQQAQCS